MYSFEPFSATHAVAVVIFVFLTITGCVWASRADEGARQKFENWLGAGLLAIAILYACWWLLPRNFEIQRSLPLHMCDVLSFVAPFALLTNRRGLVVLAVFWGLGFCTQAFLKPLSGVGPLHPERWAQFWGFWLTHASVVFTAIYFVWARGFRPRWADFRLASWVAYIYVGAAFMLDATFGFNYVYVGRGTPKAETFADALGPWPLRVVWIAIVGQMILTAVMLLKLLPPSGRRSSLDSRV